MLKRENKYLKFLLNFLLLIIFLIATDQFIGIVLRKLYFRQQSGLLYRTTYAIDSTKADILVFGSSRANHHYVPEVFEDSLQMSFYNTGRDGNFFMYNYAVFKAVTQRHKPKLILFDINPNDLFFNSDEYDRLSTLLPYYRNHSEIRDIISLKSPFEKFKMLSSIYPFNSNLLAIAIGNTEFNKKRKADINGYIPLNNFLGDTNLITMDKRIGEVDTNKLEAFKYIIKYCNDSRIPIVFIQSPMYARVQTLNWLEFFDKISTSGKINYLDFVNCTVFISNPRFFQDIDHLNNDGATYFSKIVVKGINDLKLVCNSI